MRLRTTALALAVAAGLLLLAPDALAGGWSFEDYLKEKSTSDWESYGVGTMTHRRMSQDVVMPGQPRTPKMVMEEKQTLVEITKTEYVIKIETLEKGTWSTKTKREKKDALLKAKVEDQGTETLTLGGTAYPCTKKKVTWTKDDQIQEIAIVWTHAEKGILKMRARAEMDMTTTVRAFEATKKVGEVTLLGRTLDTTMITARGMTLKGSTLRSLDVPGNLVRNELMGGGEGVRIHVLMELIGFTKK